MTHEDSTSVERSDDLDARITAAGSTDPLMRGLVRAVRRTRAFLIATIAGLILDLALSAGLALALVNLHHADDKASQNTVSVRANTVAICNQANKAAASHNDLVDALLAALAEGTGLPPAEREARANRYAATRVPIIQCSQP